jgi:hypothetical protein
MDSDDVALILTPEEVRIILAHRAQQEKLRRATALEFEILKVAAEYHAWLRDNGAGDSFSTFCGRSEFGYTLPEHLGYLKGRDVIHNAAMCLVSLARRKAQELGEVL